MFQIVKRILQINRPYLFFPRNFYSERLPLTSSETLTNVFQSLIYKPLVNSKELEQLFDVCLFFSKIKGSSNELSNQDHQKIILCFFQYLQGKEVKFSVLKKFMQYSEAYKLSNRINSTEILRKIMTSRNLFRDQKNLPPILNFFTQTNVPRVEMNSLMDQIMPIYDKIMEEISDSVLISLFYHVVFLKWKYDKKPDYADDANEDESKNIRKNMDNIDFLEACEAELEYRLEKMTNEDFVDFSRILTLNSTRKYKNEELFAKYLEFLLQRTINLKEEELISIVKNLRFFNGFPENFIEKFEAEVQKTDISNYKNPKNLYLLLAFIRSLSKKSRSSLMQNILLSISKNTMKSITPSTYNSLQEFGKNRDRLSMIFNDLIFLVFYKVEENEFLKNSDFPKELLKVYQEKIKSMHVDVQRLIKNIEEIKDIYEFLKVLAFVNQINAKDALILDSLFGVFKRIQKYSEIKLQHFAEIFMVFHELNYYIDPTTNPEIFEAFFKTLNNKIQRFKVVEIYQLIKILAVYIRLEVWKNSDITKKFIDSFNFLAEKCIQDQVFFIMEERIELLRFISYSIETCKSPLVDLLISYFSYSKNQYLHSERENIAKNDSLNRIFERITSMRKDIGKLPPELDNLLIETQKYRGKDEFFKDLEPLNWVQSEVIQYLGLLGVLAEDKFELEQNVREHSFDFDLKLKSKIPGKKDIYVDFLTLEWHCYLNLQSQPVASIVAKDDFLKNVNEANYVGIFDYEWESVDKKELLKDKLTPFFS